MQVKLDSSVLDVFEKLGTLNEDYHSKFLKTSPEVAALATRLFYDAGKIGILDIENFHKAFDIQLDKFGFLSLFDADGKLLHKGTWGKIKDADKTDIVVQALRKFWAWQFVDGFKPPVKATAEDKKEEIAEDSSD